MAVKEKPCSRCGKVKPASEFYKAGDRSSGLSSRCKACSAETARIWRRRHKAKIKDRQKRYEHRRYDDLVPKSALDDYIEALYDAEREVERLKDRLAKMKRKMQERCA